jgi:hypothetical protein
VSAALRDIGVVLADRPGALAEFGAVLGAAGVSLEGGGVFTHDGVGVAHFLVAEAERARGALEDAGLGPVVVREVVAVRLAQETPGQLGRFARLLADAGVGIEVQYSDHEGRLIVVVKASDEEAAARVASEWGRRHTSTAPRP